MLIKYFLVYTLQTFDFPMKKPLLERIHESPHIQRVLDVMDKFIMNPDDEVEAAIIANKDEVNIVFKIVKAKRPKNFADSNL